MRLELGIKSDPVEYRYSYEWLFDLMAGQQVNNLQLGSSMEFYRVDDEYFIELRASAEKRGIRISSCFTAHRELGGFFAGNPHLELAARAAYERWIDIAALVGADCVGSNPGAVYRDRPESKDRGIGLYLRHLSELQEYAFDRGVRCLTVEPMSSLYEPPSTPDEIEHFMAVPAEYHAAHPETTVPVRYCGDISHGVVAADETVVHGHWSLFEQQIPNMIEFHFKNTDGLYGSTFGFEPENLERGIIKLDELAEILDRRGDDFPADSVIGYLEIGGPKLGRDYSDPRLRRQLEQSLEAIQRVFR